MPTSALCLSKMDRSIKHNFLLKSCVFKLKTNACCTHQHVLGQPSFIFSDPGGDTKCKTFLAEERVSSVAAAERLDLPPVWYVCHQRLLWITRPIIHHGGCKKRGGLMSYKSCVIPALLLYHSYRYVWGPYTAEKKEG